MVPSKPKKSAPRSAPGRAAPRRRPAPVVEAHAHNDRHRLSWRAGIFLVVIALVLVMFLPSINSALKQAQQIAALNNEISTTRAEVEALQEKNDKLNDPTYIARRAREEQYYVQKGENAVIVINRDALPGAESDAQRPSGKQAWYLELLESIHMVGNTVEKG